MRSYTKSNKSCKIHSKAGSNPAPYQDRLITQISFNNLNILVLNLSRADRDFLALLWSGIEGPTSLTKSAEISVEDIHARLYSAIWYVSKPTIPNFEENNKIEDKYIYQFVNSLNEYFSIQSHNKVNRVKIVW